LESLLEVVGGHLQEESLQVVKIGGSAKNTSKGSDALNGIQQAIRCKYLNGLVDAVVLAGNVVVKTLLQKAPVLQTPRHVRFCRDMSNCVGKTCQTHQVTGTSQKTRGFRVMKTFEDIFNLTIKNAFLLYFEQ
jgi:hypothetical protein